MCLLAHIFLARGKKKAKGGREMSENTKIYSVDFAIIDFS